MAVRMTGCVAAWLSSRMRPQNIIVHATPPPPFEKVLTNDLLWELGHALQDCGVGGLERIPLWRAHELSVALQEHPQFLRRSKPSSRMMSKEAPKREYTDASQEKDPSEQSALLNPRQERPDELLQPWRPRRLTALWEMTGWAASFPRYFSRAPRLPSMKSLVLRWLSTAFFSGLGGTKYPLCVRDIRSARSCKRHR